MNNIDWQTERQKEGSGFVAHRLLLILIDNQRILYGTCFVVCYGKINRILSPDEVFTIEPPLAIIPPSMESHVYELTNYCRDIEWDIMSSIPEPYLQPKYNHTKYNDASKARKIWKQDYG